jgi:outer membrane protein OmpA-like peptidoglycan-associated protein
MSRGPFSLYARYGYGLTNMDNTGNPATVSKFYNNYLQFGAKVRLAGTFIPADSDGDGIADPQDSCPTQVGSAKYTGCPIPDGDGDGVNDEQDRCPTQVGVARYGGCPPPDTDGDRVNDDDDRCPTQAGVARYNGCPPPDTDGDGVLDDNDRCPTEAGFDRYSGCPPPDTDRDGLDDLADRCPTVAGIREMNGCPRVEAFEAQRVTFASGNARLTATGMRELDKVVGYLMANAEVSVSLDGHTDSTGPDRVNNPLSARRAEAAKAYLVSRGIAGSRITTAGRGSSQPVAPNDSEDGRARNRRVEVTVK